MDDTKSFWTVKAEQDAVLAQCRAGDDCTPSRSERSERGMPCSRSAGKSSYLEVVGKHCDKEEEGQTKTRFEVRCAGCRSRFCKNCCVGLGLALRERLIPVLETFRGLMMWTFTIDPSLFVSPAAAYQYVKDNRCISRTMRELRRGGFLHSRRYVVFVEWQKETEMPHWHVLADASFVPFNAVCDIWNRFRPISAGPVHGERPGFGSIRFTAPKFKSPTHAARYGCKYLIKYPEHGYPAWVLASHDVHRFSTSRGFWPTGEELREQSTEIGPGVVVEEQEFPPVDEARDNDVEPLEKRPRTTIAERLAGCGEASVVLRIASVVDMATGEVREVRRFVGRVEMPLRDCAAYLGRSLPDRQRRLELMEAEAMNLFTCKRSLNGVERQLSHFSRVTRSVPIGDWCSTALDNDVMHGVIHTLWMLKTTSRC